MYTTYLNNTKCNTNDKIIFDYITFIFNYNIKIVKPDVHNYNNSLSMYFSPILEN